MAHFCIVAPINILHELHERGQLGCRHLLLAHDVVKYPEDYGKLFGTRKWDPRDLIILDNSAYELKSSVDVNMVMEAAKIVRPNCVVLPDHYLDGSATAVATLDAVDHWRQLLPRDTTLMAIPQGKTFKEWVWCAEQLANHYHIDWWGVPRNLFEHHGISRRDGVSILFSLNKNRKFHLFGFSNNYVDDLLASMSPFVNSIDSTTPLRAGSLGLKWSLSGEYPPRGDWWDTAQWNDQIVNNLLYAQSVFSKGW